MKKVSFILVFILCTGLSFTGLTKLNNGKVTGEAIADDDPFTQFPAVCLDLMMDKGEITKDGIIAICSCIAEESKKAGLPASEMAEIVAGSKADFNYESNSEIFNESFRKCLAGTMTPDYMAP